MALHLDQIPIENFIAEKYRARSVQAIVESWNVEPVQVIEILARSFREMGVYRVSHVTERVVFATMLRELRQSPEIQTLLAKARREDLSRKKSRHAD